MTDEKKRQIVKPNTDQLPVKSKLRAMEDLEAVEENDQIGVDSDDEIDLANFKPLQKQILLTWTAAGRPIYKIDKDVLSTIIAGTFLISVILFFIDGAMPVIMLASIIFLLYVLGNTPPHDVKHTISNWGIESEGNLYVWESFTRYWIDGKGENRMMVVETALNWPRHLRFMLGNVKEDDLVEIMQTFLIEDKPAPNWADKASTWLEKRIRLTPDS